MVNASGGCEAAVTARMKSKCANLKECSLLLCDKITSKIEKG